jgi:hypothetical protein
MAWIGPRLENGNGNTLLPQQDAKTQSGQTTADDLYFP